MELSDFERKHVIQIYDLIADEFDKSRYSVWPSVIAFLNSLSTNSSVLEVGCGNGKNMLYRKDINMQGIDTCQKFIDLCAQKGLSVKLGNCLNLEFEDNLFDACLCIAVIHHLDSREKRLQAIREMYRVVKPGGKIFIQVWGLSANISGDILPPAFDKSGNNELISGNNKLVDWKHKTHGTQKRFYHFYDDDELKTDVLSLGYNIVNYFKEQDNWIVQIDK
jgi:ubiquinone/menaquinone biosynthesis C-methylase UbiE